MEKCNNCGWELTEDNVRLAVEDAGMEQEYAADSMSMTFCCPSYSDEHGCQGTARGDASKMAYWYYTGK